VETFVQLQLKEVTDLSFLCHVMENNLYIFNASLTMVLEADGQLQAAVTFHQ
jgi:hypothetical protein